MPVLYQDTFQGGLAAHTAVRMPGCRLPVPGRCLLLLLYAGRQASRPRGGLAWIWEPEDTGKKAVLGIPGLRTRISAEMQKLL